MRYAIEWRNTQHTFANYRNWRLLRATIADTPAEALAKINCRTELVTERRVDTETGREYQSHYKANIPWSEYRIVQIQPVYYPQPQNV